MTELTEPIEATPTSQPPAKRGGCCGPLLGFVAACLLVLGLIFLSVTSQVRLNRQHGAIDRQGVRTTAVVARAPGGGEATVEFLANERPYTATIALDSHTYLKVGEQVDIVYDRGNPAAAYSPTEGPTPIGFAVGWAVLVVLVFPLWGTAALLVRRSRRRSLRVLAENPTFSQVTLEPWSRRRGNIVRSYLTIREEATGHAIGLVCTARKSLSLEGPEGWELHGSKAPGSRVALRKGFTDLLPNGKLIDPEKERRWRREPATAPGGGGSKEARTVRRANDAIIFGAAPGLFCLMAGAVVINSDSPLAWALLVGGCALGLVSMVPAFRMKRQRRRMADQPLSDIPGGSPVWALRRRQLLAGWNAGWVSAGLMGLLALGILNLR